MASQTGKGKMAESVYISAGCNRYSNVADVRQDGLVAYGAGKLVCLWDSESSTSNSVHQTLSGHAGNVTTIKFLPISTTRSQSISTSFLSGDTSGKVILWSTHPQSSGFRQQATLKLAASIGAVAALELHDGSHVIAVGTSDGRVSAYALDREVDSAQLSLMQTLDLKTKIPMDMALAFLPGSKTIILAIGGTDSKIHLFTKSQMGQGLVATVTLPGHADWIRCLCFSGPLAAEQSGTSSEGKAGDILLASGSQDSYIRLWRFTTARTPTVGNGNATGSALDILDQLDEAADGEIAAKQYDISVFCPGDQRQDFAVTSESVLLGHDGWITGLHWQPDHSGALPLLLSASADRSMILWEQDSASQLWLTTSRFGEIGGTNLGFFGALFGKDSRTVLAHGWGGSFHCWRKSGESSNWKAIISPTGHFDEVTSLAWEPEGEYLVSVSADQTARLHAPWTRGGTATWHELSRPQIHGYDMEDVAFLSRTRLISGSEEKIIRVFDAPKTFIESMRSLGVTQTLEDDGQRPNAATVPALGLSNKAVHGSTGQSELNGSASGTADTVSFHALAQPPFEEQLLTSTLWPETEKLYGHGYEINAIAASHDGSLIASACRASTAEHAVIRLHQTSNWAQILPPLAGHTLTVTAIRFSPDDRAILTSSRDRSWQLYERASVGSTYSKVASGPKAHARIIWDCCWAADGSFFATASRDRQVKIWGRKAEGGSSSWSCLQTLAFPDAVTAIALMKREKHLLAVGTEAGTLSVHSLDGSAWLEEVVIPVNQGHVGAVRRLAWRPQSGRDDLPLHLASCSDDRSLRVHRIHNI